MNPAYHSLFFLFFILLIIASQNRKRNTVRKIIQKKRTKGRITMNEIINMYLGKTCTVTVSGYSQIKGKITSAKDNWIVVETKSGNDVLNLDYVVSIKEFNK